MTADEMQVASVKHYLGVAKMAEVRATFDALAAQVLMQKAETEKRTAELVLQRFQNENRPSIILKASLSKEGDKFVASFGCLSVEGETPEIAFQNFDSAWVGHE